jgi:hypothetical protein
MADLKISALPASTTPLAGTEVLPIVQSSATRQVSVANLTAGRTQTSNGIVQGTAATGYNFTANTPVAGMTSQLLNWYEEGTWTGTLTSLVPPITPPTAVGRYTRIGRQVTLYIEFSNVNTTGGVGAMYVTGIPFTAAASTAYSAIGTVAKYQLGASVSVAAIGSTTRTTLDIVDANDTTSSAIVAGLNKYLFATITYTV